MRSTAKRALILMVLCFVPSLVFATSYGDLAKARGIFSRSLQETLEQGLRGWETQYVEKPSFPFVVERETRRVCGERDALLAANKRFAKLATTKPQIRIHLINALAEAGITAPVEESVITGIAAEIERRTSQNSSFLDRYVTLVIVGWGSGDHEEVKGEASAAPSKVAATLVRGLDGYIR